MHDDCLLFAVFHPSGSTTGSICINKTFWKFVKIGYCLLILRNRHHHAVVNLWRRAETTPGLMPAFVLHLLTRWVRSSSRQSQPMKFSKPKLPSSALFRRNYILTNSIKACVTFAGSADLEYGIIFVDSHMSYFVDDIHLSEYLQTWVRRLTCTMLRSKSRFSRTASCSLLPRDRAHTAEQGEIWVYSIHVARCSSALTRRRGFAGMFHRLHCSIPEQNHHVPCSLISFCRDVYTFENVRRLRLVCYWLQLYFIYMVLEWLALPDRSHTVNQVSFNNTKVFEHDMSDSNSAERRTWRSVKCILYFTCEIPADLTSTHWLLPLCHQRGAFQKSTLRLANWVV